MIVRLGLTAAIDTKKLARYARAQEVSRRHDHPWADRRPPGKTQQSPADENAANFAKD
jgi:hypothetical protein